MKKIVIQAGHINCKNNSIVAMRGNTGAPGEQELTKRIADRLASILRNKGFEIKQTDACANDDKTVTSPNNWDLFLALHGDADYAGDGGSGFATFPEPSTDGATAESQRIAKIVNSVYFPETKIIFKDRSNANTKFYYMWKYLSAKTPCVLIEMGQVQDPHDKVLLANTDLIANAIARAICNAFSVPFDVTPPPVVTPVDPNIALIASLKSTVATQEQEIAQLNSAIVSLKTENETKLAELRRECELNKGIVLNKLKEAESYLQ